MLRASGQSEVWSDARPEDKFHQYGWRCGTSEDGYGTGTLIVRKESKSFPGHQLELDPPVKLQDARVQQENTAGRAAGC
ncbi:unnamed protein product [Coregonus sp. 'balchen']|nr:unnamed protein product [Coregonus sp. 'balchen']